MHRQHTDELALLVGHVTTRIERVGRQTALLQSRL